MQVFLTYARLSWVETSYSIDKLLELEVCVIGETVSIRDAPLAGAPALRLLSELLSIVAQLLIRCCLGNAQRSTLSLAGALRVRGPRPGQTFRSTPSNRTGFRPLRIGLAHGPVSCWSLSPASFICISAQPFAPHCLGIFDLCG